MTSLVVGGGAYGTALVELLAQTHDHVDWWVRDPKKRATIRERNENPLHARGHILPEAMELVDDLPQALQSADLIIVAVPAQGLRAFWTEAREHLNDMAILVGASKGIEVGTGCTVDALMNEVLGEQILERTAYLSGPTFAREMLAHHPSAAVVAAQDLEGVAHYVQHALHCHWFRTYTTDDVVGVEVAGATKNVMAIAAGILDGLGFGHNARAALITRGLAEMRRLGMAMGAQAGTFAGLAGMGDLVLTCTGDLSRNRSVGLKLGAGQSLEQILAEMNEVAEGVKSSESIRELSRRHKVEMPITEQVFSIIHRGKDPRDAVGELMGRSLKTETE